jgi:hypothetical protein
MSTGTYGISVTEARGLVAVNTEIDKLCLVMGCSSLGSGLSPFYASGSAARTARGYGDAVDTLCHVIEQKQPDAAAKVPAAMYTLPVVTDGSYGAVDDSLETGTAVVTFHSATKPNGTYEPYLVVRNGGLIGTDGITFQDSLNGGRALSQVTALGTAAYYLNAEGNVRWDFSPATADLTALNTLINELFTDMNAHFIYTTLSVHGAADSGHVMSAGTYPSATDTATRVARVNAERAAYEAHRITLASVHGAADTTNVVSAPVATDDSTALMLALNLKAVYNAHCAYTTGGVHGSADATNTTSSPAPSAGSLIAGDIIRGRTVAPAPNAAGITAACAAIAAASIQFGFLVCDFDLDASLAAALSAGRATMATAGKRVTVLARTRLPDLETSETESAWFTDIATEFRSFYDSTAGVVAIYGFLTDAMSARQYLRSGMAQVAADIARVGVSVWFDSPSDRKMANFTLVDANGTTIGHDEGPRGSVTGLSDSDQGNRFICCQRLADANRMEEVFTTAPWTMFSADERIRDVMTRRIANKAERIAISAAVAQLGGRVGFTPATTTASARLTDDGLRTVQKIIFRALSSVLRDDIQNSYDAALDTGLVQVSQDITVSSNNLLNIPVTISAMVFGYMLTFSITLAVQQ